VKTSSSTPNIDETVFFVKSIASGARVTTAILVFVAFLILLGLYIWPHQIGARGGLPIPGKLLISVTQFFQGDRDWGDENLGNTPGTLADQGCAVSSASMVLSHYGMDVNPGRLNSFLQQHHGYEGTGWLRWESAAEYSPGLLKKAYEDLPSYALIDWNLLNGNPVIVRIRLPRGITHFVVIVGKQGIDYLIRDPSSHGMGQIYPLKELGVPIEALRYYRTLPHSDMQESAREQGG